MAFITFENSGLPDDQALKNIFNAAQNPNLQSGAITDANNQITKETLAMTERLRKSIEENFAAFVESLKILQAADIDRNLTTRVIGMIMIEHTMMTAEAYSRLPSADHMPGLAQTMKKAAEGTPHAAFFQQEIEDYANFILHPNQRDEINARQNEGAENHLMNAFATIQQTRAAIRMKDRPDNYAPKAVTTRFTLENFSSMKAENLPKSVYSLATQLHAQLTQS